MRRPVPVLLVAVLFATGAPAAAAGRRSQGAPPKVSAQPVINEPGELRSLAAGSEVDLVLQTSLDAAKLKVDDRFEATAIACRVERGQEFLLAPGTARGFVGSLARGGAGRSRVTLSFDEWLGGAKPQRLRAAIVQIFEGRPAEKGRLDTGTGAPQRDRVALAGVLIGVGGTITATDGRTLSLPAGTIVRIRLEQPIDVRLAGR